MFKQPKYITIIMLLVFTCSTLEASRGLKVQVKTRSGKTIPLYTDYYALVIGVGDYQKGWSRLPNPTKDAKEVADTLKELGFKVKLVSDPTSRELKSHLRKLISEGRDSTKAIVLYFAGHGHTLEEAGGKPLGYIISKDVPDPDIDFEGFSRVPESSPLWQLLNNHYESFEQSYEEMFEQKYGFFRPIIKEVVYEYLNCGDLKNGFARVKCKDCCAEYLLAFSCKGRWFCPSCHSKKVIQFGELLKESILYPVPHRQYVFSIPIMLRLYFKYDRGLLTNLCRCAYDCLLIFLRNTIGLQDGAPGVVMTIHTFGDYPERFHPHIHAIVSDGLFRKSGTFHVMPKVDLKPLEEIFSAKVFKMLKEKDKIDDDLINKLLSWKHSGFSVHNEVKVARDDEKGREALALDKLCFALQNNRLLCQGQSR